MVVITVISAVEVWLLYRVQPYTWSLGKPILAGALTGALAWHAKGLVAPAFYPVIGVCVVAAYGALLAILRFEEIDRWAFDSVRAKVKPIYGAFG
jgi:hypothetical protein